MSALLISTQELADRCGDANVLICDCRHDLMDLEKGRRAYAEGHIPGAHFLHLDEDLSGKKTGKNGRHPLPTIDACLTVPIAYFSASFFRLSKPSSYLAYPVCCQ